MFHYPRLRDLREDSDKRQEDIAEILETAREQYNRYELGKQELPMHHFITLAKYYNVSLDYLAGLIDKPRKLK
jgi:transcriptional regulator with XRE-family HTH domain